jgi:4-carboxymuconolactone decarboxylase
LSAEPERAEGLYARGLEIRKEVLGDDYVEKSLAAASEDDFTAPLQELVTEYCWGAIWSRGGLDRRTRSMLNLAMMAALDRQRELKLHLRGALNNGVTKEEIREVLLQATVYCGIPAGLEAFRTAREALEEVDG